MNYIDLSWKIDQGIPVYPGDEEVKLVRSKWLETDHYNAYSLSTGLHAGTHIDCPMHLLDSLDKMADYPLDRFAGRGFLIDARGEREIRCKPGYDGIRRGDIVLVLTGTDQCYGTAKYYGNHPVISLDLADFLVSREIRMLGVDMPSPDDPPFPVHKRLLGSGIFLLENLTGLERLLQVQGDFEVFAAPLKINAEASLTRAFARVCEF
jgi:kynurenine formamidase